MVNRRIDEEGKPVPKILRLGSLSQICRDLEIPDSGKNTNNIRKALLQNASAFITAKLNYKSNDGTERHLEAGFTRYNIVFTGDRLPNGRKADAVHLVLNDPYWEVLNNAPVRPLDYDYLKELPPAPQRFYEVISYRVFATLKYKGRHAKIAYSDYCTFSAQQRYFDYDHFKKQMYKVHRPHLQSRYLANAHYEEITDSEGHTDWMMYYEPGSKAKAEYAAFTRKGQVIEVESEPTEINRVGKSEVTSGTPTKPFKQIDEKTEQQADDTLLNELTKRGVTKARAQKLISSLAPDQQVLNQLEWGDHLIAKAPQGRYANPPGFYVYLIQSNVFVPSNFETSRKRHSMQEAHEADNGRRFEQYQREAAYEEQASCLGQLY